MTLLPKRATATDPTMTDKIRNRTSGVLRDRWLRTLMTRSYRIILKSVTPLGECSLKVKNLSHTKRRHNHGQLKHSAEI